MSAILQSYITGISQVTPRGSPGGKGLSGGRGPPGAPVRRGLTGIGSPGGRGLARGTGVIPRGCNPKTTAPDVVDAHGLNEQTELAGLPSLALNMTLLIKGLKEIIPGRCMVKVGE
jgi:hypothetical protein